MATETTDCRETQRTILFVPIEERDPKKARAVFEHADPSDGCSHCNAVVVAISTGTPNAVRDARLVYGRRFEDQPDPNLAPESVVALWVREGYHRYLQAS